MSFSLTFEQLDQLSETFSDREISKIHRVSVNTIWLLRKKLGVRSFHQKSGGMKKDVLTGDVTYGGKNLIHFNERFFQFIDSEHKAYFLGFIAADGHVRKSNQCCQISIQKRDEPLLLKLADCLNLDRSQVKSRTHRQQYEMSEVYLSRRFMCEDLKAIGIVHNKSLFLKIVPGKIPCDLIRHFIRGYSDGNGTFYRDKDLRIVTGSKEFSLQLMEWLTFPGSKPTLQVDVGQRKNPLYVIRLGRRIGKAGLLWLYQDQTISLERKFAQFSRFYP